MSVATLTAYMNIFPDDLSQVRIIGSKFTKSMWKSNQFTQNEERLLSSEIVKNPIQFLASRQKGCLQAFTYRCHCVLNKDSRCTSQGYSAVVFCFYFSECHGLSYL